MPAPPLSRNPTSLAGAALTTASAVGFCVFLSLEWFGLLRSPYAGMFGYLVVPVFFVLGLALIPFGMWREGRRRARGTAPWSWPPIDLSQSRTRGVIAAVLLLTIVNVGLVAVASVGVVHYTESNQFCGQVCHTPMTPEFTAHALSPHAKVECVSCHVSPGAGGLVTAKLNGTRQLYLLAVNRFSRPIPEPIGRIPTAVDTCAQCHTPGRPERDVIRRSVSYGDDEENTEDASVRTFLMAANHWHARADVSVEFVASDDKREKIPYVRATGADGKTVEYFAEGVTARPAGAIHRMDCLDCHSRPAHTFSPSADRAVDGMLATGAVSLKLPFVRREMVAALNTAYPNAAAAKDGIAAHLAKFYEGRGLASNHEVPRAITATQLLYSQNVFPDMKVTWGTYTDNLNHRVVDACFRCHDDEHKAKDGRVVRQDCDLCHRDQETPAP